MAPPLDPYRTLGLSPGASADEIRRAYRRLAKANHPDSAGEAALPRFLAIQAAYELLTEGQGRRPSPARASRPDPARAGATGTADRRRRQGASTAGSPKGSSAGGPTGARSRTAGPDAGSGPAGRARPGARPSRSKATLGSTSYDAAEDEPFEPEWSGGTWYGASSGTYWTLNPKEYADPRKHGPEYQRRARRRVDPADDDGTADDASFTGDDFRDQDSESAAGAARRGGFDGRWTYPDEEERGESQEGHRRGEAGPASFHGAEDESADEAVPRPPLSEIASELADRILTGRISFYGRFLVAFLGWIPIGALIGWLAGEVSGCGRFTASCVDPNAYWSAIPQVAVYSLLVLLPSVAAVSAAGFVGALVLSGAAAVILSAGGGAHQPETSGLVITVMFVAGYVIGAVFAVARRLGWRRVP